MAEELKAVAADQEALLFAIGRLLTEAELEFVLIAGPAGRRASVMSNVCPGCALAMLTSALSGAAAASVNPDCMVWEPTLQ